MGTMLPGAPASSAFLSPASTHGKPRDSQGMVVCTAAKGICWILREGQQECDCTVHLPVQKVAV